MRRVGGDGGGGVLAGQFKDRLSEVAMKIVRLSCQPCDRGLWLIG